MNDIAISLAEGIGTITFDRPDHRNTVRPDTMRELCGALNQLTEDPDCRVIILRAEGKHFSAGADFAFLESLTQTAPAAIRSEVYNHFQGAVRRLYHCPKPTIALVQGAAVTVGCELAIAADFRIASEDAFFQESWIKLGIMPPLGGTFLLPRIVGSARASEMLLRARPIKAQQALEIGLVSEVVERDLLDDAGRTLARELAQAPALAYRATKESLQRGLASSLETEWAANVSTQAVLLSTADFREGLDAVKAGRPPVFRGC